ncbi:hypothetical protein, partial [Nitrobacter vulgaris]|uniref:hypothetical protein n=1 Tax=Nitrobacter vulgaris TaxID=29421 RepID=UPI00286C0AB1
QRDQPSHWTVFTPPAPTSRRRSVAYFVTATHTRAELVQRSSHSSVLGPNLGPNFDAGLGRNAMESSGQVIA